MSILRGGLKLFIPSLPLPLCRIIELLLSEKT